MDNVAPILTPRESNKIIEVDGQQYEVLPQTINEAAASILLIWERLGRPKTVFSDNGGKLMDVFISTWMDLFPKESKKWIEDRKDYQLSEKTIREQVKTHSGRSLASVPLYIHKLMKLFFKEDKNMDRNYYIKLVKKFPIFRMANKV